MMTKERLEEIKTRIIGLRSGYSEEGDMAEASIEEELIAEVERLQEVESTCQCRVKLGGRVIVSEKDKKLANDVKRIRQARTRGHGERPGAA